MDFPIRYKRNRRAKYLRIKILPNKTVEVVVPPLATIDQAKQFVNEHTSDIEKVLANKPDIMFKLGNYQTKEHSVIINFNTENEGVARSNETSVQIRLNPLYPLENEQTQKFIQSVFTEILRFEAKRYIPQKVHSFATKHKLSFKGIKINSAKTRWGSCSSVNQLNFSCLLMALPYHLIDYVILHELSHTIHKNHSPQFYKLLNQLSEEKHPVYYEEMKQYTTILKPEMF